LINKKKNEAQEKMKYLRLITLNIMALVVLMPLSLTIGGVKKAQADLLITPVRVVMEGRDRSAMITLINNSNKSYTYRMGWKFYRMDETGAYEEIADDDQGEEATKARMIKDLIRFSPRQVRVEPGGRQRIRLSLRKPSDLAVGEYRAHMAFERLPEIEAPSSTKVKGKLLEMHMTLAFTIPVMVRHEISSVDAKIENVTTLLAHSSTQNKPSLQVVIKRFGDQSTYGRMRVLLQQDGKERQVGLLNNVALFHEIERRYVKIPLDIDPSRTSGKLRIVYEGDGEYRQKIWDEAIYALGR